jgi:predicted nucleotidyltransferase
MGYGPSPEQETLVESAETQIATAVEAIVNQFDPLQILLFGSHARGTATRHSDIDLLVVMSDLSKLHDKRRTAVAMRRVLRDIPIAKDIVVTTPDEIARRSKVIGCVIRSAIREGKLLYDRT